MKLNYNDYVLPYLKARQLNEQLKKSGKDGARSSKRTDVLNDLTISKVLKPLAKAGWEFKTEQRIICSRGEKFKIDIVGYYNGQAKLYVLLKAVQSSYNKNRHNYANGTIGEPTRIFGKNKLNGVTLISIDWIPYQVPAPTKDNKNKIETTKPPDLSSAEEMCNFSLSRYGHTDCLVRFVKIRFDYKNGKIDNICKKGIETLNKTLKKVLS